ncbi:MAG: peptidoglycan-binding protein, partial [Candidatus Sungbacteria bacterium]|nr:peptidoglycan-binding protein [Candidatus Sungbacteria bacterium]
VGSRGDDVTCLQNYLKGTGHFTYAGGATGYFGSVTKTAVAAWQAANGVSPAAGYWGSLSQAKYSSMAVVTPPVTPPVIPPVTPPVTPGTQVSVGKALSVTAAAVQPAASIVPNGVSRAPFTNVVFTAGADGDIVINSLTIQRDGIGSDSALSGIVLVDETGMQVGLSKTLNSNHQAVLNSPLTVKEGTSRTLTIGANRGATTTHSGEVIRLTVVAADAGGASVTGLPVTGTGQTINESLTIGTFVLTRGPMDPGSSQTKEVGTTGYTFASIKGTAGSGEDVWVKSIRWNQSGSAAASDLANIKTYVGGTAYDTTVSSDGKYYVTTFGTTGLQVLKGNNVEMYVKGDIVSGSNRTIRFDLYRYEDINVIGNQYGFGVLPSATNSGNTTSGDGTFQTTNPNFDSYIATVGTGSLTVSKSTSPAAQNIAVQLSDQPLGGYDVEVKGEAVQVTQMVFRFQMGGTADTADADIADITNISLVDPSGKVVAGPKDGAC